MAHDTQPAQPESSAQTEPASVLLDLDAVWDAVMTLRAHIAESDFQIPIEEEDAALAGLARDAVALNRLVLALRDYNRSRTPDAHEKPIADAEQLRDRVTLILAEHDAPAPDFSFSGSDIGRIARGLHQAVGGLAVPSVADLTEETGRAFYQLADTARALAVAATGCGSYVFTRVDGMKRARANR